MLGNNFLVQFGCRGILISAVGHRENASNVRVLDFNASSSIRN
jgi:hypothetical protein